MELNTIKLDTTWSDAATRINANNQKIGQEIDKLKQATYKNKGYFKTLAQLQDAYPTAGIGSKAYVGTNYPYAIYIWESGGWTDSGETGGDESLDLSQYYTKEEVEQRLASYLTVLPQDAYDAIVSKEDKFYFTTEDDDLELDDENEALPMQ